MSSSPLINIAPNDGARTAKTSIRGARSSELVFAVVGHVGSGTSVIAESLDAVLREMRYDVHMLKARDVISDWARRKGKTLPDIQQDGRKQLSAVEKLQDLGDDMRAEKVNGIPDHTAVAKGLIRQIRKTRARAHNQEYQNTATIQPNGEPRAYILDSLRHSAEVELLRAIYGPAFTLIGVVCEEDRRRTRLTNKYSDTQTPGIVQKFMERDANAKEKHGQHVSDAFHMSDFFLNNSENRQNEKGESNKYWDIPDKLSRLVKLITRSTLLRPTVEETAMYHAHAAKMRSACLSRQVGAAIIDARANIISTGTNEAPKGAGGVYVDGDEPDYRCAYHTDGAYCRNTQEQQTIIHELINNENIPELSSADDQRKQEIAELLSKTRIGGLLEFSRAVHAEMDAIVTACRTGNSLLGTRLFVTTYPCHYCARHIVAAGVDEVQFIEPYPKSRALLLHSDSITVERSSWTAPSKMHSITRDAKKTASKESAKVLFRQFTGIAPRRYEDAFLKVSELKDRTGKMNIAEPEWLMPWDIMHQSYIQAELKMEETP